MHKKQLSNLFSLQNVPVKTLLLSIGLLFFQSQRCDAYSVLTHEAIIDANWEYVILPLLKAKCPGCTAEAIKQAHAYAYGGAVVPDIGYYPYGSKQFTNLIHYVRSGDFVIALLQEAQDINEYAFALGVLCHYEADRYGHNVGINPAVPLIYPDLEKKFGKIITYAEDHLSHIRTEFAFDVLQTARGNYASTAYHDFIGFEVSKPVLERAFFKTYGLNVTDLFGNFSKAVGTFRWVVKDLFPVITKAAWATKKKEIQKAMPNATSRNFIYKMHRRNYYHEFGKADERPTFFAEVISIFIRIAPKVGPLKALQFKTPGPDAEKLFIKSFDSTLTGYAGRIAVLKKEEIHLPNIDCDTGDPALSGEYPLTDEAYDQLILDLHCKCFESVTGSLKANILSFYAHRSWPAPTRKRQKNRMKQIQCSLEQLKITEPKY